MLSTARSASLKLSQIVVGDVHHQRARPDAAEIGIDVVRLADAIAPDQIDRVIELGAVGDAAAGLLVRRIPVEDLGLHRRKALRGAVAEIIAGQAEHRPAERDARTPDAFPSGSL